MRIGIDCRLWSQTGVGRYVRNLVVNLLEIDRENEYVLFVLPEDFDNVKNTLWKDSGQARMTTQQNWKIVETDIHWHSVAEQLQFPRILNKENLDIMHFPYFSVPVFYKKPFVMTMHDLIVNQIDTGRASTLPLPLYKAKRLAYNFVIVRALRNAKKIIVPSHAVKEELIQKMHVSSGKIDITYEGAELGIRNQELGIRKIQKIRNKQINQKWKMENGKYLLYVGNAYPHKNLERLIEAFGEMNNELRIKNYGLKLVLVGKEDYFYKRLKEKVLKLGLKNEVIFAGKVSDEELVTLYKNAKALVIPSLLEGFGLIAVEAMSLGCPVLASNIPVLREICGDAAVYFNPLSIEDVKNKIESVCSDDSNHQNRIQKGFERAKKFSWRKMAEKTLEIYKKIS